MPQSSAIALSDELSTAKATEGGPQELPAAASAESANEAEAELASEKEQVSSEILQRQKLAAARAASSSSMPGRGYGYGYVPGGYAGRGVADEVNLRGKAARPPRGPLTCCRRRAHQA